MRINFHWKGNKNFYSGNHDSISRKHIARKHRAFIKLMSGCFCININLKAFVFDIYLVYEEEEEKSNVQLWIPVTSDYIFRDPGFQILAMLFKHSHSI